MVSAQLTRHAAGPCSAGLLADPRECGQRRPGLAEWLAAAAGDPGTVEERVGADVLCERLGELLQRAPRVGAVRADVELADVEVLMVACMSRHDDVEPIVAAAVTDGLRAR